MKSTVEGEKRKNFVRKCYYCGREGHFQRNCPVLLEEVTASIEKQDEVKTMTARHSHPESEGEDRGICFTMTTRSNESATGGWIVDTGCTKHMTNSTDDLGWWNPCSKEVLLADGKTVKAKGSGKGRIATIGMNGEKIDVTLKELLYVPGLSRKVLSVSRITEDGYTVVFGQKDFRIMDGAMVLAVGKKSDGLYYLQ